YRLPQALICLNRMLVLEPNSGYALRRRAWIYSQREDMDRAEADYRRAVEIDTGDDVARLGLAQILLNKGKNPGEAAAHFERLWSARRDTAGAAGLAQSWRLLGRLTEARGLLDDWLKYRPADAMALTERARLALDEQKAEQTV